MEADTKNSKPAPSTSLPALTLGVLVALIAALLYIGYEYISDDTGDSQELTNVPLDTVNASPLAMQGEPEELLPPLPDSANTPMPVDLSQATPPAEEDVASEDNTDKKAKKNVPEAEAPVKPKATEKLISEKPKPVAEKPKPTEAKPKPAEAPKPEETKPVERIATSPGAVGTTYTVGKGETLYSIANRLGMKISDLKELNPELADNEVKSGVTRLNVKVRAIHTVGPGDLLRVVAAKYGVSKEALMKANHKTRDIATRGERLIIPN